MKNDPVYIKGSRDGWHIELLDGPSGQAADANRASVVADTPRQVLEAVAKLLPERQHQQAQIVIGVPADWCLCATVSAAGLPAGRGKTTALHEALAYRLETELPITVEDYTIGFAGQTNNEHRGDDARAYLGVAVRTDRLKPLIHALEDAGHEIEAIVPAALLIPPEVGRGGASSDGGTTSVGEQCFLWCESSEAGVGGSSLTHLVRLRDGQVRAWRCLSAEPGQLAEQLRLEVESLGTIQRWHVCPASAECLAQILGTSDDPDTQVSEINTPHHHERSAARSIADGSQLAGVNLRRGALVPRHHWRRLRTPAIAAIAAALLLLVSAMTVMLLQAQQYQTLADQHDERARQAFAQALPDQRIPTSPQRRLEGRLKQLRGEQGLAAGEDTLLESIPALLILQQTLNHLPEDQRFAITDLRIEDGAVRLTGQARSHGEADQLAGALRRQGRFTVDPPSTENLPDGGVRFTLQATPPPEVGGEPAEGDGESEHDDDPTGESSLAQRPERRASP